MKNHTATYSYFYSRWPRFKTSFFRAPNARARP